jgi:anti-sigma factor RsiW
MDEETGERIRKEATYYTAPPGLRARVLTSLPKEVAAAGPRAPWRWATGFALAFSILAASGIYFLSPSADDRLADEIIAAHVRSMMVDHAFDVASSDTHTVKPWFAGKLDFSPPVVDLAAQGFALAGGRLDYLDRRPVAALVYRHREHIINLFVSPASSEARLPTRGQQGFHLAAWERAGMRWWAVSDVNAQELAQFRAALEKATAE